MEDSAMFDDARAASLVGKHLLVGLTHVAGDGEVKSRSELHGIIVRVEYPEGIVLRVADSSTLFTLPPDLDAIHEAKPGKYTLKSTGESCPIPTCSAHGQS